MPTVVLRQRGTNILLRYIVRRSSSKSEPVTERKKEKWKSVVGLEIHAQILSRSKLFSGASTEFGSPVNSNVSYFDAAIPGTLPVLNRKCVEAAVLTALSLSCKINKVSWFDRKHYFYADLPTGYQITQQRAPIAENGEIHFQVFTPGVNKKPYEKSSHLKQLQLEQDSGKSLHDDEEQRSLVDLNRAGMPLMELVFEPDLTDGEEAAALVKELCLILTRIKTCSCKMEEGALRVDANISVHQKGQPLGTRTEIKNISSIRGVANAIDYEINRQIQELKNGKTIVNETRAWDAVHKQTVSMRDKEEKQDYRYMPEPNLPPLRLFVEDFPPPESAKTLINVANLRKQIPELPEQTRERLRTEYGLPTDFSFVLVNEDILLQHFFHIVTTKKRDPKRTANLLIMDLLGTLNKLKIPVEECTVNSSTLGEIIDLLQNSNINIITARKLLKETLDGNYMSPSKIVEEKGWFQITDPEKIRQICQETLSQNTSMVQQYHQGKTKLFGALLGIIAKQTEGKADMEQITKELKSMLSEKK